MSSMSSTSSTSGEIPVGDPETNSNEGTLKPRQKRKIPRFVAVTQGPTDSGTAIVYWPLNTGTTSSMKELLKELDTLSVAGSAKVTIFREVGVYERPTPKPVRGRLVK